MLTLRVARPTNRAMLRSSQRPSVHRRAILALIAALLFAFPGALSASFGRATQTERHVSATVSATASQTEATLCVGDLRPASGHTTPHDSHCASDCCMAGRGPSAVLPHEAPVLAVAGRDTVAASPRAPPAPVSGWASSWSSRAPPAR
jgi:hypothetical protein